MKTLLTTFILLFILNSYGQKEIKPPELDTKKNTYTLKFSPDPKIENVLSAYMKGKTEVDSLRFWAKGTTFTQKVVVTVISPDKNAKIKVDIVKDHWNDSKINGYVKEHIFQEHFDTSNKFGIVVTSDTPDTPFYLAVYTSGEKPPNMSKLYYPISDKDIQEKKQNINTSPTDTNTSTNNNKSTNTLLYIIMTFLAIIILLLAFMIFKKKSTKTLSILVLFFLSHNTINAEAFPFTASGFGGVANGLSFPNDMNPFALALQLGGISNLGTRYLALPEDENAVPNPNPAGSPRLPSSCIQGRFRDDETINPDNEEGCSCLKSAYEELDKRRLNLERLRIIYAHAMKKINAGIAFGDGASAVHGVSALAWQSQKMIILKESIPTLNKAYDDKYAEMISALEENLLEIDRCENLLGYENWYSQAGFIYYQFMADKYKRN